MEASAAESQQNPPATNPAYLAAATAPQHQPVPSYAQPPAQHYAPPPPHYAPPQAGQQPPPYYPPQQQYQNPYPNQPQPYAQQNYQPYQPAPYQPQQPPTQSQSRAPEVVVVNSGPSQAQMEAERARRQNRGALVGAAIGARNGHALGGAILGRRFAR